MTLTLDLDSTTERMLKLAASQSGTSSQEFAIDVLKDGLSRRAPSSKPLKRMSVATLLEEINRGMSEEEWARYSLLTNKRRKERVTKKELAELCEISDRLEEMSARRLEFVVELARRRGTTFDVEFQKLGLEPRYV